MRPHSERKYERSKKNVTFQKGHPPPQIYVKPTRHGRFRAPYRQKIKRIDETIDDKSRLSGSLTAQTGQDAVLIPAMIK